MRARRTITIAVATAGLMAWQGGSGAGAAGAVTSARPTVRPAAATIVQLTPAQMFERATVMTPIATGYNPNKFVTAAQWAKRDARGCDLRKRLLISAATIRPKVGAKCRISGGTWYANAGTVRITDFRKVKVMSLASWKTTWGLGAYAWTPAQRYAWATNVMAPPRTRAKGVTPLQATNQVLTADLAAKITAIQRGTLHWVSAIQSLNWFRPTDRLMVSLSIASQLRDIFKMSDEQITQIFKDFSNAEQACDSVEAPAVAMLSNATAWGLGISPALRQTLLQLDSICKNDLSKNVSYPVLEYFAAYGITPVSKAGQVTDGFSIQSSAKGSVLYTGYENTRTDPVSADLFGMHAPPDTGSMPNVPYGYLRLWDSAVSWADLNPAKGQYNWTKLQEALSSPMASNRKVMYVLGNTPAWAGDGSGNSAPKNMSDVYDFVRALCGQAQGRITTYEAWNEGNLQTFWKGTPAELADLTAQVRRALTDCPFGGNVVAASTGTRAEGAFATNYGAYLDALAGLRWPIDGYSVHSYPSATGGPIERLDGVAQFTSMLAAHGAPPKPIYDSEVNYGLAGLGQNHMDLDAPVSTAYISRTFIDSVRYGIDSVFWFLWTPQYYNKLGIQLNPTTAANATAWRTTYDWLVGYTMQRCVDSPVAGKPRVVITACQMSGPRNMTLIFTNLTDETVDVTGLGSTQMNVDGVTSPVVNGSITVGYSPIAVF